MQEILTVLPDTEAQRLARRLAGARGIPWPTGPVSGSVSGPVPGPAAVSGVGGFTAHLTHLPGRDAVAWATVGKTHGLLGLFSDGRLLAAADRSLAPVLRVQAVPLPGLPHLALMVDDLADETPGVSGERRRIYVWDGRGLRQLFLGALQADGRSAWEELKCGWWNARLRRLDPTCVV